MERSVLASVLVIGVVAAMLGAGTVAYFNDTETMGQNVITAGTLDLTVDGENPCTIHITFNDIAPGFYAEHRYLLKNIGTLDGRLWLEFSTITNNDNGLTDPESDVDNTGGAGEGELGEYLELGFRPYGHSGQPWTGWISYKQELNNYDSTTGWMREKPPTVNDAPVILTSGSVYDLEVIFQLDKGVGNVIQSDSVEFDIIFHLEQV